MRSKVAWLVETMGISKSRLTQKAAFSDRLKVQKAAFLLNYLGKEPFASYDFNLYVNGPYSSKLASDYYNLQQIDSRIVNLSTEERTKFDWFVNHEPAWLEVASTILLITRENPRSDKKEIFSILQMSKPWVRESQFNTIFEELSHRSILR